MLSLFLHEMNSHNYDNNKEINSNYKIDKSNNINKKCIKQ